MEKDRGFTLVELMVVTLIVSLLAALLVPLLLGRIHQAKWSEGKAAAGTIATALRAYWSEHEGAATANVLDACATPDDFEKIGLKAADLDGKYFETACYSTSALTTSNPGAGNAAPQYTITVDATKSSKTGHPNGILTLDERGVSTGP